MDLKRMIRDVPDFPKQGIIFKDITPLLANSDAFQACFEKLKGLVGVTKVDKVIGIEARGFIFGGMLAKALDAGFVPVRKKGKLPYDIVSKAYNLEYGTDALEMHQDAINKGDRVLIHDDVLATGGTAKAVQELVRSQGGVVVQCNFIIELDFLKGREKLDSPIAAALTY